MKAFKLTLTLVLFAVCLSGFAQKVKIDDSLVTVDGAEYVKLVGGGMFDSTFSIQSMAGDELVFGKVQNPGQQSYYKVTFIGLEGKTFEGRFTKKTLLKNLYNDKVIVNGQLDPKKVDVFISKYEENISGYKTAVNNTQTIIIKEEPRRSGVNINIGN